jgi:dihydrofolate synthase/folylpolyglutamate synthase
LEVSAGGYRAPTNIVNPDISVITCIELDHTKSFGNSLLDIAREKSGIIKYQKPVVVGPNSQHEFLRKVAEER